MAEFRINVAVDPSGAVAGTKMVQASLMQTGTAADRLRQTFRRTFAVLGGAALVTNAVRTISRFQDTMAEVRAVTGATEEQFRSLSEEARRLGSTTRFSASEAASAMAFLGRAGFETNEVLSGTAQTLQLAQAGALELGQAADIASNVLSGFRLNVEELARVTDVLAAGAANSNTSVEQLGQAMSFTAPVSAGLGVSLEETAAAIGILSDNGIQATRAGTSLNRIMSELVAPTDATAKAFEEAGVSLASLDPTTQGIVGVLQELERQGFTTAQAFDVFGQRGGPALSALLGAGSDAVAALTMTLQNSQGAAEAMAVTMSDTLGGALDAVGSAWEAVILSFNSFVGDTTLADSFRALADALRAMARNMELTVQAAGSLLLALAAPHLLAIAGGFAAINGASTVLIATLTRLRGVVRLLLRAFAIGFIIEGIQRVIGWVDELNRVVRETPATWGDAAAVSADLFANGIIGGLVGVANAIPNLVRTITDPLTQGFSEVPTLITAAITGGLDEALSAAEARIGERLAGALVRLFETFQADTSRRYVQIATESQLDLFRRQAETAFRQQAEGQPLQPLQPLQEVEVSPGLQPFEFNSEQLEGLRELQARLDPVSDATRRLAEEQMLLNAALRSGELTQREFSALNERLTASYRDLIDPLGAAHRLLDQEQSLAGLSVERRRVEVRLIQLENTLRRQGVELSEQERVVLRARIATNQELSNQLSRQSSIAGGLERGFTRVAQQVSNVASAIERAVTGAFKSMEDALVSFLTTGEGGFRQLADTILSEIARIAVRQAVLGPLLSLFGGFFRGGGRVVPGFANGGVIRGPGTGTSDSILAALPVGGYVVNAAATRQHRAALDVIAGAPTFNSGGAILGRVSAGEYLVPPGPARQYSGLLESINKGYPRYQQGGRVNAGSAGTQINIYDQRTEPDAPPVEAQSSTGPDGQEVLNVVIRSATRDAIDRGDMDAPLARRYGIRPALS